MNANELIDDLYDIDTQASQQSLNDWAEEAATMLRQQQESIEGLNRDYDLLFAEHQLLLKKERVELTDEEIEELANEYLFAEEDLGMLFVGGSVEFARSILKKAQKK